MSIGGPINAKAKGDGKGAPAALSWGLSKVVEASPQGVLSEVSRDRLSLEFLWKMQSSHIILPA